MFEDLKLYKSDQAFHYRMQGDKTKQLEPPEVFLHFPGGFVGVTRCRDDEYWIHLSLQAIKDKGTGDYITVGKLIDSRIDCKKQHAAEADLGDLNREDLYHVALKVKCIAAVS